MVGGRLEDAVETALTRIEHGHDVTDAWLEHSFPDCWREVRSVLDVHDALAPAVAPADRIGRYRIGACVGVGAMGTVYAAEVVDPAPGLSRGTRVAVKFLHAHLSRDTSVLARFSREAELGRAVVHPHVVHTFEAGRVRVDGRPLRYLAMEFVEGGSLRDVIRTEGPALEPLLARVAFETTSGLAAIHKAGAIHGDIKPENLLIDVDGRLRISDLGIAFLCGMSRASQSSLAARGSLPYAAPEQLEGERPIDVRADLYALGLVLHELATGSTVFGTDAVTTALHRRLTADPPSVGRVRSDLSPGIVALVDALTRRDVERRPRSADEVLRLLAGKGRMARGPAQTARHPELAPMRGRRDELAELRSALKEARRGNGSAVVLRGEAGIGKTRLAQAVITSASDGGMRVLQGSAWEDLGATALAPLAAALRRALEEGIGDASVGALTARLHQLVGAARELAAPIAARLLGSRPPDGALPLDGARLAAGLSLVLRGLAREQPMLVVLEDVHRLADVDRALLGTVAERLARQPVALVVTARPIGPVEGFRVLELLGLCRSSVRALIADALQPEPGDDARGAVGVAEFVASRVAEVTGGNPFHVLSVLHAARESGRLRRDSAGGWRLARPSEPLRVPEDVRDAARDRLDRLSERERRLLELAACVGPTFDPGLLAESSGTEPLVVLRRLQRIVRRTGVVRAAARTFRFDHDLLRGVLLDGMEPVVREPLHRALGRALALRGAALLACEHRVLGASVADALPRLDDTLNGLAEAGRVEDALRLARMALEDTAAVRRTRRVDLLLRAADFTQLRGRHQETLVLIEEARAVATAIGDRRRTGRCALRLGHAHLRRRDTELARAALEDALGIAVDGGFEVEESLARGCLGDVLMAAGEVVEAGHQISAQARLARERGNVAQEAGAEYRLARLAHAGHDLVRARRHALRALRRARRAADIGIQSRAIGALGAVAWGRGLSASAIRLQRRRLALSLRCGDLPGEVNGRFNLAGPLLSVGATDEAMEHVRLAMDVAQEIGMSALDMALGGFAAEAAEQRGDLDAAERELQKLVAAGADGHPLRVADGILELGLLRMRREQLDEARPHLRRALEIGRKFDDPELRSLAAAALARLGDVPPTEAANEYRKARSRVSDIRRLETCWTLYLATKRMSWRARSTRILARLVRNAPARWRTAMLERVAICREVAQSAPLPTVS